MAFDMFLKIEGIEGESKDAKHKDQIEVLGFNWSVAHALSATHSSEGPMVTQQARCGEFNITKALDRSSPMLFKACVFASRLKKVVFELCRAGGEKQPYMQYIFYDAMISSLRPVSSGGPHEAIPIEELSFVFAKIEWIYFQTKVEGGQTEGRVSTKWDLTAHTMS